MARTIPKPSFHLLPSGLVPNIGFYVIVSVIYPRIKIFPEELMLDCLTHGRKQI